MRSICELASTFFISAIQNETVRSLVTTIQKLEGFRSSVTFGTTHHQAKEFLSAFYGLGFETESSSQWLKVIGDTKKEVDIYLLYHGKDFKGAVGYIESYQVMLFSWSIKTTEPFSIPLSFFDNIPKGQQDSPFNEWALSFPTSSGFYRDSQKYIEKIRLSLTAMSKEHDFEPLDSGEIRSITTAHTAVIEHFATQHQRTVRLIHLNEDFQRQTDVTSNILTSKFNVVHAMGIVIDNEKEIVGLFNFTTKEHNTPGELSVFSFLEHKPPPTA